MCHHDWENNRLGNPDYWGSLALDSQLWNKETCHLRAFPAWWALHPLGESRGSLVVMIAQMKQPYRWRWGHPSWPLYHYGSWPDGGSFSGGRNRASCARQHKSEPCLAVDCFQCSQAHICWPPAVCKLLCSFLMGYKNQWTWPRLSPSGNSQSFGRNVIQTTTSNGGGMKQVPSFQPWCGGAHPN